MDNIICTNCGKPVKVDEALRHQFEEKFAKEQEEKYRLELEKAVLEAKASAEKATKEITEKELEESNLAKKKLEDDLLVLKKQNEEAEGKRKEQEDKIREEALKEATKLAEQNQDLKLKEKDIQMEQIKKESENIRKANEDLKRKLEQGSQQLQGEVLELDLEEKLKTAFPNDEFLPVPKGVTGGDIVQNVKNKFGNSAGIILWETKRTKAWSKGWLTKLKDDMRKINASDCILVTDVLPEDVKMYDRVENVWVTSYDHALKLVSVLRLGLMNVAIARSGASHSDEQLKELYKIITSDSFRHMFEARNEVISHMRIVLEADKRATERKWKLWSVDIDKLDRNNNQLYGELQAHIPSLKPLHDIAALELDSSDDEDSNLPLL